MATTSARCKSHARQAGAGGAGRAGLGSRCGCIASRHHAAHPRHPPQHSGQSQRQSLHPRRNRSDRRRCREHDLFVFTDEIYEYFVYDGARHICPATLDGMRERTIVMSGFSKTFCVTGWRLGYVTADANGWPRWATSTT